MRLGILVNLAVILVVSGILLFFVFAASLQSAVIDTHIHEATVLMRLMEDQVKTAPSEASMKQGITTLCRSDSGMKLIAFNYKGDPIVGCSPDVSLPPPDITFSGRRARVLNGYTPWSLIQGITIAVDVKKGFPFGVSALRGFFHVPSTVFSPAMRFFAFYLFLTHAALFFLGYILFHRTVVGPISETAKLAGTAAGMTEGPEMPDTIHLRKDIQGISASLKALIMQIIADKEEMTRLVNKLKQTNQDLEDAQRGLVRSEKMASVGRLAAGLAHEIGNPLQILIGYAELLKRGTDQETAHDIHVRMENELARINETIQRILEFARPSKDTVRECDINELVQDVQALVKGRKGFRRMEFRAIPDESIPRFRTEPEKVRQILVNLVLNAADAIPQEGGVIILRTSGSADRVRIEVEDNGCGIPSEDLPKVFDPFFSTKEPGKGTGLGLAVCLSLVESLDGTLEVTSEPGKGTVVSLELIAKSADNDSET
jgi:signal transduction histidine kinase